jgi:hypothetical protein
MAFLDGRVTQPQIENVPLDGSEKNAGVLPTSGDC